MTCRELLGGGVASVSMEKGDKVKNRRSMEEEEEEEMSNYLQLQLLSDVILVFLEP